MRLLLIVLAIALAGAAPAAAKVHVPRAARAVDTSHPDRWVGSGTPQSCTSRAVVRAVAKGGIIRFRCGPDRCEGLTSADGDATGETFDGGGGGAIFARGGRLKIVRSTFTGHRCDPTGPDLGGGAVRALPQFHDRPVFVVRSTFRDGACSNRRRAEQHRRLMVDLEQRPHGEPREGNGVRGSTSRCVSRPWSIPS